MKSYLFSAAFWSCIFSLAVGCAAAQPNDTLQFIHISDPHICFLDHLHPVVRESRAHYGNGIDALAAFLAHSDADPEVDFVSITGDMVDFYEADSCDGTLVANQLNRFVPIVQHGRVPVYLNIGNHDIATYSVNDGKKLISTQYQAHRARAAWIRSGIPCFKEGTYYSRIRQVGSTRYRLIFLDNGYYALNPTETRDVFCFQQEQQDWLSQQLAAASSEVVIIFTHIPFKPDRKVEEDDPGLFEMLLKSSRVKLVLCGHRHIDHIHQFQMEDKLPGFAQVMTGAFGRDPNHWRKITLTESSILVSQSGSEQTDLIIRH